MRGEVIKLLTRGLILVLLVGCGPGCGYRFAGSGSLPGDVTRIAVDIFENRTATTGAENVITASLVNEFTRRGGVVLAEKDSAEAVLSGKVKSISTATITHADQYVSAERRLTLLVEATLTARDGEVLWAVDNIRETYEYPVASEDTDTAQSRQAALSEAAEDMAGTIYNRLISNF
ncbi:MAG: LPS assembly lipoprotein LptE [Desulfosudaceae bacterium]